jgi:CRISPR type I-E-associated protein CasB/Cse2
LALLAATLPRVRPPSRGGIHFARALGEKEGGGYPNRENGERPRLSEMRFGTLMRALDAGDDTDRALRALRRVLPMLDDAPFDVGSFVRDLIFLSDETRRRWVFDYWQTSWQRPAATAEAGLDADAPAD